MKIFFWVIASIILIHIIGLVGVFIAIGYLIWSLIDPQKIPCLFCRWRKVGETCPVCNYKVQDQNNGYPKSFKSVIINSLSILVITFISLFIIFLEANVLSYYGISPLNKNVSFVIPTKGQYLLGEVFPIGVDLAGVKTNINTVRADISFDPQFLELMDISTDNSFGKIFVQKEINNEVGFARISGGVPNPGVNCFSSQNNCHFASFIFKTKKPGTVQVKYLPTSLVLANDGMGSNILKDFGTTSFLVLPEMARNTVQNEKSGSLNMTVLGTETGSNNQLNLYQGNPVLETSVLGANTTPEVTNTKPDNLLIKILTFVQKYDSFVVSFVTRLKLH